MRIQKLILGLVIVFAVAILANGYKSDLSGKIQDYSGNAIFFSTLEVYKIGVENRLVYKVLTGMNGEFELPDLVPGKYRLVIKTPGFKDFVQIVQMNGMDKNLGTLQLNANENIIILNPAIIYGKA